MSSSKCMEIASTEGQRANMSRMDLIRKVYQKHDCVYRGESLICPNQVLVNNGVQPYVIADRVRTVSIKKEASLEI